MKNKYKCESVRLCRFLYGLGFDKESKFDKDGNEYWLFERSPELQSSLDFFFCMRKQLKNKKHTGANESGYKNLQKMQKNIYCQNGKTRIL